MAGLGEGCYPVLKTYYKKTQFVCFNLNISYVGERGQMGREPVGLRGGGRQSGGRPCGCHPSAPPKSSLAARR